MSQYGNYTFHPQDQQQQPSTTKFDGMSTEQLDAIVNKAARSNQERTDEALAKADSYAFQIAHPELKRTDNNTKIINHQLEAIGITHPSYADFELVVDSLKRSGLLDIDTKAATPTTFKGHFTGKSFDSLETMILQERHAALQSMKVSQEEIDLEGLPLDKLKNIAQERVHTEQRKVASLKTTRNGDAWVLVTPAYRDTERNARLMLQQLANNGVNESEATIPDYKKAFEQLLPSGLLGLNQVALKKAHQEKLRAEAAEALTPELTEEEMYDLPMEELEARTRNSW
jgi:hypothetical protein